MVGVVANYSQGCKKVESFAKENCLLEIAFPLLSRYQLCSKVTSIMSVPWNPFFQYTADKVHEKLIKTIGRLGVRGAGKPTSLSFFGGSYDRILMTH